MKQYIALFTLLLSVLIAPTTSALTNSTDSLLFGWQQAYSAVVRADGKVITYGKIYLNNDDNNSLKQTSFSLPDDVNVTSLSAYQILLPERCSSPKKSTSSTTKTIAPEYPIYTPTCESIEQQTYELDQYSYYSYYDRDTQLRYKPIDLKKDGQTYEFTLPEPLKHGKRGAYIVSYATSDYTSETFGLYKLEFKTLQLPRSTEEVRVSVDVSSDLYTKAGRSSVESGAESVSLSAGAQAADGAIANRSLDTLQGSIGSGGTFTKTGKALTADETFIVKGEFADAAWKLYIWTIVFSIVGVALLIVVSVILLKKANTPTKQTTKKGKK